MGRTSHPSGKLGRNMVPIVYQMQREWQNGEWRVPGQNEWQNEWQNGEWRVPVQGCRAGWVNCLQLCVYVHTSVATWAYMRTCSACLMAWLAWVHLNGRCSFKATSWALGSFWRCELEGGWRVLQSLNCQNDYIVNHRPGFTSSGIVIIKR